MNFKSTRQVAELLGVPPFIVSAGLSLSFNPTKLISAFWNDESLPLLLVPGVNIFNVDMPKILSIIFWLISTSVTL